MLSSKKKKNAELKLCLHVYLKKENLLLEENSLKCKQKLSLGYGIMDDKYLDFFSFLLLLLFKLSLSYFCNLKLV